MEDFNKKDKIFYERKVVYGGSVKINAKIQNFPKALGVIWTKGFQHLDQKHQKYKRTSCMGQHPALCIDPVTKIDEDVYMYKIITQDQQDTEKFFSYFVKIIVVGGKSVSSENNSFYLVKIASTNAHLGPIKVCSLIRYN